MDEHVRFSGTKYAKGNNTYNGNHYECGEKCSTNKTIISYHHWDSEVARVAAALERLCSAGN